MKLEFAKTTDREAAEALLAGFQITAGCKYLEISTDGTTKQVAEILNRLNGSVPVARFTQNQPSLEDVFLTLIGEKQ
ncbi:MAG: DUF4162 domain-containing protein [Defluviitaleaceae bacterium]|nr:DUF4162 domain-containing protein [Defluviitaleaceae bacterium]